MIDLQGFAQLATGAADAADRAEADGEIHEAEALRELAENVERFMSRVAPPNLPDWCTNPTSIQRRSRDAHRS